MFGKRGSILIEIVGKEDYKRESTIRIVSSAIPWDYMKKNGIRIEIVDNDKEMEKKSFLYPGLLIDGRVFCEGRIPKQEEVRKWVERITGKRITHSNTINTILDKYKT